MLLSDLSFFSNLKKRFYKSAQIDDPDNQFPIQEKKEDPNAKKYTEKEVKEMIKRYFNEFNPRPIWKKSVGI